MILVSTHAKLVAKGATIYRVDFPEFEIMGNKIAASHEHFATRKQAEEALSRYPQTPGKISSLSAADFNPWEDR